MKGKRKTTSKPKKNELKEPKSKPKTKSKSPESQSQKNNKLKIETCSPQEKVHPVGAKL